MNKIEEVATAIAEALHPGHGTPWRSYEMASRAAIIAMRAPTDAMIVAGSEVEGDGVEEMWRTMSFVALEDE